MAIVKCKKATERMDLGKTAPLETPVEIQISVASACNFKCIYCPTSSFGKGVMSVPLYEKLINDLHEFPEELKVIRLTREGEPLMHPRFPYLVEYAKKHFPNVPVDTTTNASLLTHELSEQIIDAGMDKIFISLQGITSEAYKRVAGVDIDFEKLKENVIYFMEYSKKHGHSCKSYIKVPDLGVTDEEVKVFFKMFDQYADEVFVERMFQNWPGWTSPQQNPELTVYGSEKWPPVKVCAFPFYVLLVDVNGIIRSCIFDWQRKTFFGDANKESLYSIWNGKRANDWRKMQLRGERREYEPCKVCEALESCEPDLIDGHEDEVLKRMEENETKSSSLHSS